MDSKIDQVEQFAKELREKEQAEILAPSKELVEEIRRKRREDKNYWDVPKDQPIEVFDPTLSYELVGYRPITLTEGLDFDPSWFTGTRDGYRKNKKYCPYLPKSKRYNEFWKEEYKRCREGMSSHGYTITGDNYFFLNFYVLPIIDPDKKAGEGTDEDFPTFFVSHYIFFHYLNLCRVLRRNCCMLKARSLGFSEIMASINIRMYEVIRRSRCMITCYNDKFLHGTFSKVDHGINWLNINSDLGMFKAQLVYQKDKLIKSGYKVKVNGQFQDQGYLSEIAGVNGNDPSNIRGDRVDLLFYDEAGCHIAGTKVIMFDGTLKNVEDIQIGDILMGPDGTQRTVIELHSGQDQMYKIIPNNGKEQIVNSNHILYGSKYNYYKKIFTPFEMKTKDYYNMISEHPRKKDGYKLQKSVLNWESTKLPINPYLFGFWLGDGDAAKARFTSKDPEIIEFLEQYAQLHNSKISKQECKNSKGCYHISFLKRPGETTNWFCDKLREMNVFNNKHIPYWYICNDRKSRLALLAGLIDSDGNYNENKHCIEITQYEGHKDIITQAAFIARSLGMKVSEDTRVSKERKLNGKIIKGNILQHRMRILSGYSEIPTLINRKKLSEPATTNKGSCDNLTTNFKIEPYQVDTYYGFTLKEDPLFLLDDFTVVHNSWPDLATAVVQGQELCEVQGRVRGIMAYGGTGGDKGPALEGLKKIYYNPKAYKVLPYRHHYTQDGTVMDTGFFLPYFQQSLDPAYMDSRGVCDTERYINEVLQPERDNLLSVPEDYPKKCAERCWFAEEAFQLEGNNKFNKVYITDQIAAIKIHKRGPKQEFGSLNYVFKSSTHNFQNLLGLDWREYQGGKTTIIEHPVWSEPYKTNLEKLRQEAESKGMEFDPPKTYEQMDNLYVAGIDGIDIGQAQTSEATKDPSSFCCVIVKRGFGLQDPQIVAMYKDRPNDIRQAYKQAMALAMYYNAKINIEATRMSMVTWARDNKILSKWFMKRPRATLADVKSGSSNTYGTPATKIIISHQTDLIANFVEDYCHSIWNLEVLDQLLTYSDEMKGKFDIVAALGMALLADEELTGRIPLKTYKHEEEDFQDFGYYTDENGYKRYGVIPKKNKNVPAELLKQKDEDYDPYRIESSDPRDHMLALQGLVHRAFGH